MPLVELDQVIIGTAGHIDHGKTALVKALTGTDTDTLAEEKKRGITIELGFAFMDTPGFDRQIIFIDVPGHERLIKTMVAGASNIDAAMLVVAADEGVSVQTIEHLDILQLFDINTGVIALTKSDLVDHERIEAVTNEIKMFVDQTFLADAPIMPVSAITGEGISQLRQTLFEVAHKTKSRRDTGVFRMPIDRVFTMQGFGAVIAGTVLSGEIKVGDKLEILPDGIITRVRGIQIHKENLEKSVIGRRTAINLQDVKKDQLRRGQTACAPGSVTATSRLDGRLHVLKGYSGELKNRERVRLHVGTDEVICRAVLLDAEKLEPGQNGLVQFVLEAPTVALPKDRFVIRTFSSMNTVGGGTILDSHPALHKRMDDSVLQALKKLEGGASDVVEQAFAKARYAPKTAAEISSAIGEGEAEVWEAVCSLLEEGKLIRMTQGTAVDDATAIRRDKFLHSSSYRELTSRLTGIINDFYSRERYRLLMPAADLQSRFGKFADKQVFESMVADLITKGVLIKRDNKIGIASRQAPLKPEEKVLAEKIVKLYKDTGFSSPIDEDVIAELRISPSVFNNLIIMLLDEGSIVRLSDKVIYHKEHFERAKQIVIDHIKTHRSITAAELRDKLNVSRKYSIAVLEYLDSIFVTRRDGDKRVLR